MTIMDKWTHKPVDDWNGEPVFVCKKCGNSYPTYETGRCSVPDPRTAQEWLDLPIDDLKVELAKVFVPKPWKHDFPETRDLYRPCIINAYGPCRKCGRHRMYEFWDCHLPDPFKINPITAMEWFRKADRSRAWEEMWCMFKLSIYGTKASFPWWLLFICKPEHLLIAAARAEENENGTV